jgi:hypothetical protein
MTQSQARVSTSRPDRYAKQLVSHLGRRNPPRQEGTGTRLTLDRGSSMVTPGEDFLMLQVYADTAEDLAFAEDVVARHLVRFGEQDQLTVQWEPVESP